MASNLEIKFAKLQFGLDARTKMYRRLTSFIRQGVPLFQVMEKFKDLYAKKKGDPRGVVLTQWMTGIKSGKSFSESIKEWVPPAEVMLIEAGETGGNLAEAFEQAIEVTEAQSKMKKAIIAGLAYPVITLLMLLGMIFMFSLNVVPQLTEFIPPAEWPEMSRGLYIMSEFVSSYGIGVLVGLIASIVVIVNLMPRWSGKMRGRLDPIPPWSIYRSFQSSIFLVALSALMKSGVALKTSLSKLASLNDRYVKDHINQMITNLSNGKGNGESLDTGLLSSEVADDVTLYGEVADFEKAMDAIGKESIEDGIEKITRASAIIGSVILLSTGFFTGWVYYAFYTLTSSIAS